MPKATWETIWDKYFMDATPYEFILKSWQNLPQSFRAQPNHHNLRLNTVFAPNSSGCSSRKAYTISLESELAFFGKNVGLGLKPQYTQNHENGFEID